MTNEEAIQVLKDISWQMGSVKRRQNIEAIDMAIESLQTESEWIPCSERLPKTGEQVLCCDSQSRVFTSALTEIASNGMTFFGQHCKVIAWMPLPKPYREDDEV